MLKLIKCAIGAIAVYSMPVIAAPAPADVMIRHATIVDVERSSTMADQAIVLRGIMFAIHPLRSSRTDGSFPQSGRSKVACANVRFRPVTDIR